MKHHLDKTIELSEESKFKNLYPWSLNERDSEGTVTSAHQIPFEFGLYFTASDVRYHLNIGSDESANYDDADSVINPWTRPEAGGDRINAILHSGPSNRGNKVSYSMCGTDRFIKEFHLEIVQVKDERQERAEVWGSLGYPSEIDFKNETVDDMVGITLGISPYRFQQLLELIKHQQIDTLDLSIYGASGFYSSWSPSMVPEYIKVLTTSESQRVLLPKESTIAPPRLGSVRSFVLTACRKHHLEVAEDLRRSDTQRILEPLGDKETTHAVPKEISHLDSTAALTLEHLRRIETILLRLRTPVRMILMVLSLLLLQKLLSL
jgi:hypothetical protein